ncbi:MAG: CopG family transcriptional regulator [Bacillota bacterium]|nr:CopG family transcriptional regulator [Candidatus Fermentithermobacillaceae bacterium]
MAKLKRVVVGLTEEVLSGIDSLTQETNRCRSTLIREACSFYIQEKRRAILREKMRIGYLEMAELNRRLAEELGADLYEGDDWYGDERVWRKA